MDLPLHARRPAARTTRREELHVPRSPFPVPRAAPGVALALLLTVVCAQARAAHLQLEGGRSYMDSHPASTLFAEAVFGPRRIGGSRWDWSPDVSLGWIDGRDVARYADNRYSTRSDVWLLAAGVRLQHGNVGHDGHGWFVSFQPAVTHGRTQALSSPYEFVSTLGWQGRRFSFQLRHVSNGGLHDPNRGETMALVGVGFDL
jgi:hypothetical protein